MFKNYYLSTMLAAGLLQISGCTYQPKNEKTGMESAIKALKSDVSFAVEQAAKKNDFRLLHSKGRRIVVPGLEQLDISLLKSQCGLKPMLNSSDVVKTTEQRQKQKAAYAYAKQYNQAVYQRCLTGLEK
ncbi:hypothetical protein [Cognaticolwellia mytili]|uniref:hypothetical protein n=1 Tax=Cognaticolwellia mytili TaxID=1888913 RepID=UPI000A170FE9|nr:hypothetical protein [Cognaticolwellia mytili]